MFLFDSRYPYDLDAPLEEPPAMDPNIGGELINKSPQWAFEADHRVQEKDNTKFRLPPEPVSSFVFHWWQISFCS